MTAIHGSSTAARVDGWLSAWVGEECVMMSADTGTCISMSETGGRVWDLLEKPQSLDELCSLLVTEYGAPDSVIRTDVTTLLTTLSEQGAVCVSELTQA